MISKNYQQKYNILRQSTIFTFPGFAGIFFSIKLRKRVCDMRNPFQQHTIA